MSRLCYIVLFSLFATAASLYAQERNDAAQGFVEPANYPLELVSPRSAESTPSDDDNAPNISTNHRIFRAYPGLEYNIRAVVLGGAFPFRYALKNSPSGMSIDENTGDIRWSNPTGRSASATITVTDAEGTVRSATWMIHVDADLFRFVDAERGDDRNDGSAANPWKTLARVKSNADKVLTVYFRSGTYRTADLEPTREDAGGWQRAELNGRFHPVQWIAYPGDSPVIDCGYESPEKQGWFLRFQGSGSNPVYLDSLEFTAARHIGLQYVSGACDYAVFRRLTIHDIAENIRGANSAGIMTLTNPARQSWYTAFQDCVFRDNACGGIKQYSQHKMLWENCTFRDSGIGPDLKSDVSRFDVRACLFENNRGVTAGLFGNMHPSHGRSVNGEIRFNRMLCPQSEQVCMDVNQDGLAGEIHLVRNTFVGLVQVRNTDTDDGPFRFTRNVIVNESQSPDRIGLESVTDTNRVISKDNLSASSSDRIVDEQGKLTGSSARYRGTRGFEIGRVK
ncbi:MAG: Ig domain-containing protein [Pirellulales bacterium]